MNIDTRNEEEVLSSHLDEYLEDERLFTVPFDVLERVLNKFFDKNEDEIKNDQSKRKKINDFLLKSLRKYGRKASILFININFGKLDRDLIVSLHNEFADVFDFNMINAKSLFETTYDLIGEIAQIRSELKILSDLQIDQGNSLSKYTKKFEMELKEIREKQQRMSSNQSTFDEKQNDIAKTIQILQNKNNEIEAKVHDLNEKQINLSISTNIL